MHQQPCDRGLCTAELLAALEPEDPKHTVRDLFGAVAHVGGALGLCWLVHIAL